jgi:hypothetical protein
MATLEQMHDRMRRIFRGELPYREGTAAEQARQFWLDNVYTDVVEAAKKNSINVERPAVDLLVSLSGFSPETTLLAYALAAAYARHPERPNVAIGSFDRSAYQDQPTVRAPEG